MNTRPFVSVSIPTRNRAEHLRVCVESLLRQDYPSDRYEINVADDGSTDHTERVVQAIRERYPLPVVRYLHQPHRGSNAARNLAISHAKGDPLCFVDDDEDVPPTWLSALVDGSLRFPDAGCLGGPMRLRLEGRPPRMCGAEGLGESELDLGPTATEVEHVWGGNLAVRRVVIDELGGFRTDLRLQGGEETELLDRLRAAGGHVMYIPDAWVWHRRTQDELRLWRLVRRSFVNGRGQAVNGQRSGTPYVTRHLVEGLRESIEHAARQRCAVGLIDAARAGGRLVGIAEMRLRTLV